MTVPWSNRLWLIRLHDGWAICYENLHDADELSVVPGRHPTRAKALDVLRDDRARRRLLDEISSRR